jgi:peptidoglycan LD-endopeptidase CwlK
MFNLSDKSVKRLQGVHPDLVSVVKRAIEISDIDFLVLEGLRTLERQKHLLQKGATKTLNSRHLNGHAVDLVPLVKGEISWEWKYFNPIAEAMKKTSKELSIPIEWGGDWRTFKDGAHFQLPWSVYK